VAADSWALLRQLGAALQAAPLLAYGKAPHAECVRESITQQMSTRHRPSPTTA
jgi:hypothetical protein